MTFGGIRASGFDKKPTAIEPRTFRADLLLKLHDTIYSPELERLSRRTWRWLQ